jgi:hypothetical protein
VKPAPTLLEIEHGFVSSSIRKSVTGEKVLKETSLLMFGSAK